MARNIYQLTSDFQKWIMRLLKKIGSGDIKNIELNETWNAYINMKNGDVYQITVRKL